MGNPTRTVLHRYGAAVAFTAVAVLLRRLLDPWLGDDVPFATLFGSAALAVWIGGYRPALFSAVLGFLACQWLFVEPRGTFALDNARNLLGLLVYVLSCGSVIACGEALRSARHRADEQRESLRVTMASMGDAVITTDATGRVTSLNPVAAALTGWPPDDAVGRPLDEVFHILNEHSRRPVENPVKTVLARGGVVGLANHTVLVARDGTEHPIDDSAAPISDARGQTLGVVLIFRDVTERRRAERSARLLAAIVESSEDAIVSKDVDGVITSWNQGAERIFGYTAVEAVGRPVAMLAPPDRADEMPEILARIRRGERVEHFDTVRRARDGRLIPIALTVSPVKDEDGRIVGASKIARDISERRRAEAALREEKERLHATLTGIGDAVIVTDAAGRVALMNPVAQALTGWAEEATGRPLTEVFHIVNEQSRDPVESPVGRVLREGTVVGLANHTTLIARDGTERPIEDSAAPVRGQDRAIVGVVLVFRDATEQRRAQQTVQQIRQREKERADELETILRATPTPIWIAHDPQCHRITGNPASFELLGLPEEANVSATSPDHDPDDRGFREYRGDEPIPVDELPVQRAARGEQVSGAEVKIVFHDGRVRHIYGNAVPLRNPDGSVRGSVAAFADVTALKEAEEALRRNQEVLKLVHQIGKIGHWEWNSLTDENKWSPEIEALYGLPPGGFEGGYQGWAKLLHPDDLPRAEEDVRRALETGGYFSEFRVIWPDGSVHWLETRAYVFKDGHDKPVRIIGVNMDVTERKRQEQRLAAELEVMTRLHALSTRLLATDDLNAGLADVLENAIQTVAADLGNIQLYNPQTRALEIVAQRGFRQDFLDYFREVRVDEGSACAQAMRAGERIIIEDVNFDPAYEPHRQVAAAAGYRAVQSTPLKNRAGTVLGMLSTHFRTPHRPSERDERLLDLYARQAADLIERLRYERALRETDRRKDEFLATLAHELRNPLAPLRNAVEVLRRCGEDGAVAEQARRVMGRQLDQMVRLIDDLLDVSRISQGKVRLRPERVELKPVMQSALEAVQPLVQAQGHELTVTLSSEAVYLDADPTRLAQVIANLLNNAAKYTEKGGHLWLTAERRRNEAVVSVRDTGIGIAAEHLPHLFEMFSQLTPALERSQGGLGIGLSLVRGLVELHGGRVEARSDGLGKGSEFIVSLPVVDAPERHEPQSAEVDGAVANGRKRRVLVVDDNRDAADSLRVLVAMMGHEVRTAYDGLEAVEAAAAFRPEIVLLDIGLPGMNGYEAARHIREQAWGSGMVLIALTGWGQDEDKRRALEAGFDHHLTKPVGAAALEKLLALARPLPGC
jgi:PAS domain S-box-containing protein